MDPRKILFVDDEESLLVGIQRSLRRDFAIETALGPEQGLTALESGDTFAVVVVDMKMPGMNGITFLQRARTAAPDAVRIMLTGNADQQTAIDAVNEGAVYRFLTKPCSQEQLKAALRDGLRQHELIRTEKDLLDHTLRAALAVLSDIMALSEPATFGASQRLRELVQQFAAHLRHPQSWELEIAASLARVGQLTLPPSIMVSAQSGAHLEPSERSLLQRVPQFGSQLIGRIPRLERVASSLLYQRKNFDGTGFPDDAVAGVAIPFGGRVLRILLDLQELEQRGQAPSLALAEMSQRVGVYDPDLLAAARDCFGRTAADVPASAIGVSATELVEGSRLLADLTTRDGLLILSKGQVLTSVYLQRLQNLAVLGRLREPVYVAPPPTPSSAKPE